MIIKMNQILVPTGYMGSGSSAITNIVSEISGYDINNDSFEFVLLHCPDGLFDLEDKLLIGNNALRSDEAIYRFRTCMQDLYQKKNYWISGYKTIISDKFLSYCDEFIDQLIDYSTDEVYWYFQQNPISANMQIKNYLRRLIGKITGGKIRLQRPVSYPRISLAFPNEEKFYSLAKKFLAEIFDDLGYAEHNLVLDQFLLPHNLFRINNYFDNNLRVIVVDRDPRDIFILNKYIWKPQGIAVPYPTEIHQFCTCYKKIREIEKQTLDCRILRVQFEDLIYNYDDELKEIYDFLGVSKDLHINKFKFFDPNQSINNTQLFLLKDRFEEDISVIQESLPEYIYQFPHKPGHEKKDVTIF